jgi:tRNA-specific 2-thiouridylase
MDASFLATGHYVRISRSTEGSYHLHKSQDSRKDQSYILYSMTQNQLSHALFPIGQFEKSQVREIARSLDLPVADKPDSQDLCFLADDTLENFLSRQSSRSVVPGPIVDTTGKKLGEHRGLAIYTIGQRKGIGISNPEPLYVIDKDRRTNTLIVGPASSLGQKHLLASELNWIQGVPPPSPINARTKIRYQSPAIDSILYPLPNGDVRIEFDIPLRDITPGQIVVFYKDNECLGGGTIQ